MSRSILNEIKESLKQVYKVCCIIAESFISLILLFVKVSCVFRVPRFSQRVEVLTNQEIQTRYDFFSNHVEDILYYCVLIG